MSAAAQHEWYFNSQPHEEADFTKRNDTICYNISTHSLTKRLTISPIFGFAFKVFQLTASRRGWLLTRLSFLQGHRISTHSLTKRLTNLEEKYFQGGIISTHSLTKRLTGWTIPPIGSITYFNSQPHEEADLLSGKIIRIYKIFQLTASRRGWHRFQNIPGITAVFQLTASRRGWQ